MHTLLRTENLTVNFGGLLAVDCVDLSVRYGQLVGLIGPNGAGKTTFIDAITGFVTSTGSVVLEGGELHRLRPHQRSRSGLGRTWQAQELFDDLTVRENVQVACELLDARESVADLLRPRRKRELPLVDESLQRFELTDLGERMPGELSQAERKLVGVARTLAGKPKLMCMDEPAAGLNTAESKRLGQRLREIVADGVAILLVDHDMGLVLGVCDYVYVLDFGRVIAQGTPAEIRSNPQVIASYLGVAAKPGQPPA
jgi:branched-chain amino acid transport system ATP-binding protein